MTEAVATERKPVLIPQVLAIGGRFGRYAPETERDARGADVRKDKGLEGIRRTWRFYTQGDWTEVDGRTGIDFTDPEEAYRKMHELVAFLEYSAGDVKQFCLDLTDNSGVKYGFSVPMHGGLFLSALINNGSEGGYVVCQPPAGLGCFGYRNKKDITVHGDVLWDLGMRMESGIIIVKGNAGNTVGHEMRGGRIIIEGSVGVQPGFGMSGGEIHIGGRLGGLTEWDIHCGKIYHKGKLLVDK